MGVNAISPRFVDPPLFDALGAEGRAARLGSTAASANRC
jgi:hypothetical protein